MLYYIDEDGERDRIVLAFTNAEKELEAVHELKSLVTVDSLTQLPNINTFSMQTWELLKNYPEREYAIVRMDIRKFRLLNEFMGQVRVIMFSVFWCEITGVHGFGRIVYILSSDFRYFCGLYAQ